jgi:hypothetical protein
VWWQVRVYLKRLGAASCCPRLFSACLRGPDPRRVIDDNAPKRDIRRVRQNRPPRYRPAAPQPDQGDRVSLDAHVWASKDAPKANVEEHGVLTVMADPVNESGEGCLLATSTIAECSRMSTRTVQRRIDDMLLRGVLGFGDQSLAAYIAVNSRPVVYNLLIPYSAFASIGRVNKGRAAKGLPPLTPDPCPTPAPVACGCPEGSGSPHARKPEQCPQAVRVGCGCPPTHGAPHRPDLPEPPPKKVRVDAGVKRGPKTQVDVPGTPGVTSSHPENAAGVTSSHPDFGVTSSHPGLEAHLGVTRSSFGGVRKSPEPKELDPEVLNPENPPTSLRTEVAAPDPDEAATGGDESSDELDPDEKTALTEALEDVLSQRHADPRWHRKAVIAAMQKVLKEGYAVTAVAAGVRRMALDPRSKYPGHLSAFLALSQDPFGHDDPKPKIYLDPGDERCRKHPGKPAQQCSDCLGEAKAVADEEDLLAAGRLTAAEARALARAQNAEALARRRAEDAAYRRSGARTGAAPAPRQVSPAEDTGGDHLAPNVLTPVS